MGPDAECTSRQPFDRLAWQGWLLELPCDWNPARLIGDAATGTVSVVDLARPRLELHWRRVRSPERVDLMRAAASHKAPAGSWLPDQQPREGITALHRCVADNGDTLALALSVMSRRLAFLRVTPEQPARADALMERILASFCDASHRSQQPWSVYGFALTVPAGFRLTRYEFTAGRALMAFRCRWRSLCFERGLTPADATMALAVSDGHDRDPESRHVRGHPLVVRRLRGGVIWNRLARMSGWQAEWFCPVSQRCYRILAKGPQARELLEVAVQGTSCHDRGW